ncbi:hypothetical protein IJD44_02410 [bacterium]|nr:hypothetical protein [bacterium]
MKKFFIGLFLILFLQSSSFAKDEMLPDPLYLSSPVLEYEETEEPPKEYKTFNEKFRNFFHLPPTKKIYFHNIDKSKQPITVDDYYIAAKDVKRSEFALPEPVFTASAEYNIPDSHYRVVSYNTPPGQRNIDISSIVRDKTAVSAGILSPDKKKMVYTKASFYSKFAQTASSAYYIPVSETSNAYDALFMTNVIQQNWYPIVSVGMEEIVKYRFVTLFPIDWSKDSTKIAFKEKIGSNLAETWQTNVIVYDFKTKSWKRLTAVREAIIYWWRQNKQIELKDYMWDIFPIGWDKNNPERLIVYAYAFTSNKPKFLGTWSIDYNEEKSQLVSICSTDVQIDLNGFGLKEIKFEN